MNVSSFPPLIDERSRILILGSMPGVASLRAYQYYGNPRNFLWRILYALFDNREPDPDYEDRLAFALGNGVALWDVIANCERKGSLDSDIKLAVPNDIPGLLQRYPNIEALVCNGAKSFAELSKHYGSFPEVAGRKVIRMPSTSPIPTPQYRGLEDRLQAWRAIMEL
ncbi:DNA-deoxyinosine glycosylase [Cohnella silvisoli]|uniref:DNA-deoxyinosine glycosylase n=1 Tax=Cohnella silvisoli TaxID=2873699 RepID=A0ABV1KUA6_9BACL|nr:DNA-deoxyinosine glycosylase [Cohnella silvisoli]MCD9023126.1 DNA-deoxyinosine glycosylase [Cohnella silvisoli]